MDGGKVKAVEGAALKGAHFRYFDLVMAAFVAILLLSNVLGAGKRAEGTGLLFDAASQAANDGERAAVADAMASWSKYQASVARLLQADPATATAIAIDESNPAFATFNVAVESVLGESEGQFIDALDRARDSVRWLSLGTLALAVLAALLVLLGFQARINEYE